MIPGSGNLSASSLYVWELCQKRFVAEQIERVPTGGDNAPANTGTAFHGAVQYFINAVFIDKTHAWEDIDYLVELYDASYKSAFGTFLKKDKEYQDGLKLVKKWHGYTDLSDPNITVLSTEVKKYIDINTGRVLTEDTKNEATGLRLTYILDRCDWIEQDGKRIIRVVDYKTTQRRLNYNEIENKLQAKIYALAMYFEYHDYAPDEIWVGLDQVRHDGFTGVVIEKDEIAKTWKYIRETARYIEALEKEQARYHLNEECKYCPIKLNCPERQRNIAAGGIHSVATTDEAVKLAAQLKAQIGGNQALLDELNEMILVDAKKQDRIKWDVDDVEVVIGSRGTRGITDVKRAADIIGPDLMAKNGKLTVGAVDDLIASGVLDDDQVTRLKGLIGKTYADPKVNIKPKPVV